MKKLLLITVLIIGILSCGVPKEIQYPNENLKFENNVVLYKGKKYSGKIKVSVKETNTESELNVKNGRLDGKGFYKGDGYLLEYNIVNSELDGEFIEEFESSRVAIEFKNGKIQKFYDKGKFMIEQYYFDNEGRANGNEEVVETGDIVAYKDGVGERPDWNASYKKYINKEGDLVSEVYKDKILYDMSTFDVYDVDQIEKIIFNKLK